MDKMLSGIKRDPAFAALVLLLILGWSQASAQNTLNSSDFASIQEALNEAASGDVVQVAAGSHSENLSLTKAGVTLQGMAGALVTGQISITAASVTVRELEITNPSGTAGIVVQGVSGVTIADNNLHDIGTSATSSVQAIYLNGVTNDAEISGNTISNVGNPSTSGNASNKGIFVGDSTANPSTSVVITNNAISTVNAKNTDFSLGGRGAYGILVNHQVNQLEVSNNTISELSGFWVHGVGLEANTPAVVLSGNTFSSLVASKTDPFIDEAAIFLENNASAATAGISNNRMAADIEYGILRHPENQSALVTATHNYWGAANGPAAGAAAGAGVSFKPWYADSALSVLSTAAADLSVQTQPATTVNGQSIAGPPSVRLLDYAGDPVVSASVSAALVSGSFSSGTSTRQTGTDGSAVFDDLVVAGAGDFSLRFSTSGASDAVSASFSVQGNITLTVCEDTDSCDVSSVQDAIDQSLAGGTVVLKAGTYTESIIIDSPGITLRGESGAVLAVEPGKTGIRIEADDITVEGLSIVGPHSEHFTEVDWAQVQAAGQNTTGIWVQSGSGLRLLDNTITNLRTAITVFPAAELQSISGNLIDNTKGSILLRRDVASISGNSIGPLGNEWDIVILTSLYPATPTALSMLPSQNDTAAYGAAMMSLSQNNGGMSVLDRRYGSGNRTHSYVAEGANPGPADDFGIGNGLGNESQPYGAIQHGITALVSGGKLLVGEGTYSENPVFAAGKEGIALSGFNAVLNGQISINAAGVSVTAMEITAPALSFGIKVNAVSNVTLNGNYLHDIGTTVAASAQAVYVVHGSAAFSGINITNNTISGIGSSASTQSTKGIFIGDSTAAQSLSSVLISGNSISNVTASASKGAYGILVNYGAAAPGAVSNLNISSNTISALTGAWVHAVGLETETAGTSVSGNTISNLNAAGTDEAAVFFEANPAAASVVVQDNRFSGMQFGVAVHASLIASLNPRIQAERNWWGSAVNPAAKVSGNVDYDPWWISPAFGGANQLSNFVPPTPPTPPGPPEDPEPVADPVLDIDPEPEPVTEEDIVVDEISNLVDDITVPDDGESVSDAVIANVEAAASATSNLATSIVSKIETVTSVTAISALDSISSVVDASSKAAANTSATGNTTGAASSTSNGSKALNSFSTILGALDTKLNNTSAPLELAPVEKAAVQEVAVKAMASAVTIIKASAQDSVKKAVLTDLGKIVSSAVNLGVALSGEQSKTLLDATEQSASTQTDTDSGLENSVPIKPKNKELVSRAVLEQATAGSGITSAELDTFLTQLADAINPADVNVAGVNGQEALSSGFSSGLGGSTQASVSFNPGTGVVSFTIGAPVASSQTDGLRLAQALSLPQQVIPGRVISSNVVSSTFPEGINLRASGAVVITRERIASIVVPASYDPINFYVDLRKLGPVSVDSDGNVSITDPVFDFSATFDYRGITSGGKAVQSTALLPPQGVDESERSYYYTVVYRDGTQQRLQPFIRENDVVASVKGLGLGIGINRNTGVITVNGRQYRPSYFIDPLDEQTRAYWEINKDSFGLAYRAIHINDDGIRDIQLISANGVQVVYGVRLLGQ